MNFFKYCLLSVIIINCALFAQDVGTGPAYIVALSEEAAKEIESDYDILEDSVLMNRVQTIVKKIMRASDIRQIFACRILDTDFVNAYALPAGPIYVTKGMIVLLDSLKTKESESALAGIIGHEIAHVYHRHYVSWERLEQFMTKPDATIPTDIATILELGYKRQQEFEADEYGVIYAMRAGYDFESIVAFYKKVRELHGDIPPGDEKYAEHPRATERIAHLYEIRAQIERDFDRFNFGVEALKQGNYNDAISHYRAFTSTFSNSASGWTNLGTAYLYEALAKMKHIPVLYMVTYYVEPDQQLRGKPEELSLAEDAFKRAAEVDTSYNIVYFGNMSIISALNNNYGQAVDFSKKALEGQEAAHIFCNNLGNALFMDCKYEDAADAYKKAIELAEGWSLPKYNLALLYEEVGEKELAIEQWVQLLDVSGFNKKAVQHLKKLDEKFKDDSEKIEPEMTLGDISIGMDEKNVVTLLGEPQEKTMIEQMLALEYGEHGLVIILREGFVTGIIALPGFEGSTARGIVIGSSSTELRDAYGYPDDMINKQDIDQWIYSTIGLLFTVADDTVSEFQIVKVRE